MKITPQDLSNVIILKSTNNGDIIQARTFGGLNIVLLRKPSGELEFLSSASTEIRSQALAAKKYPRLGVPIIVKSQQEPHSSLIQNQLKTDLEHANPMAHLTPDEEQALKVNKKNQEKEAKDQLMRILQSKRTQADVMRASGKG